VLSAGFVVNANGPQLVEDCIASVRSGDNLVIFPEGTRSLEHNGALNPLKRGAVNIALRGGLALTPVVITVSEPMLGKGQRWYHAPVRRPHFVLSVEEDIAPPPDGVGADTAQAGREARTLSDHLKVFFTREIQRQCSN
jgi:1-acyl-sn-glycerol-3-phosphate acyltransferase